MKETTHHIQHETIPLTLSEEEKEENINDETVQNRNVNTFIQTSCSLFNTRNNINVEQNLSLQATSES